MTIAADTDVLSDGENPPLRFADIRFSETAIAQLKGADAARLARVTLAYFDPNYTRPSGDGGEGRHWRHRDGLALLVDGNDEVVRVDNVDNGHAPSVNGVPALKPKPGKGGKGGKGGSQHPADWNEFLERCEAAGLVIDRNAKGHYKISSADPNFVPAPGTTGFVVASETQVKRHIMNSVTRVRAILGVDLRDYAKNGRAGERPGGAKPTPSAPPKLEVGGRPRKRNGANGWDGTPAPAAAKPKPGPTLAQLRRAAREAIADRTLTWEERETHVLRYVAANRAAGRIDALAAKDLGIGTGPLGARLTTARRRHHPLAVPSLRTVHWGDGRVSQAGSVTVPGHEEPPPVVEDEPVRFDENGVVEAEIVEEPVIEVVGPVEVEEDPAPEPSDNEEPPEPDAQPDAHDTTPPPAEDNSGRIQVTPQEWQELQDNRDLMEREAAALRRDVDAMRGDFAAAVELIAETARSMSPQTVTAEPPRHVDPLGVLADALNQTGVLEGQVTRAVVREAAAWMRQRGWTLQITGGMA